MAKEQILAHEMTYTIICKDGEVKYHHIPGKYCWRYIDLLSASGGSECASKRIDLSKYLTCRTVKLLERIFAANRPIHVLCTTTGFCKRLYTTNSESVFDLRLSLDDMDAIIDCLQHAASLDMRYRDYELIQQESDALVAVQDAQTEHGKAVVAKERQKFVDEYNQQMEEEPINITGMVTHGVNAHRGIQGITLTTVGGSGGGGGSPVVTVNLGLQTGSSPPKIDPQYNHVVIHDAAYWTHLWACSSDPPVCRLPSKMTFVQRPPAWQRWIGQKNATKFCHSSFLHRLCTHLALRIGLLIKYIVPPLVRIQLRLLKTICLVDLAYAWKRRPAHHQVSPKFHFAKK